MPSLRLSARAVFAVAASVGLLVAAWVIRPISAGPVGFDSAASVIHFDRILSGHHLEAFVTTTPKPLLTVLYGTLHALDPDWRLISWLAILGLATAAGLAAVLALRLAGVAAAGFAVLGLLGSPALLIDVSLAYAVVWALLGWLVAGLALTEPRPRFAIAGVALLLASLARIETLVLVALVAVVVAVRWIVARRRGEPNATGWWWLLLPAAAIPVMLLHDWLLTGDPWFWLTVAQHFSQEAGAAVQSPSQLVAWLVARYSNQAPLVLLGVVGVAVLVRERRWSIVGGLLGLSVLLATFLIGLAVRSTYVSERYATPIDLSVIFAAAIGLGHIRIPSLAGIRPFRSSALVPLAALAAGSVAAVALSTPFAPFDGRTRATIRDERLLAEDADAVEPLLRARLDAVPGSRTIPAGASVVEGSTLAQASVLVPVLQRPRLALDLDVPLTNIAGLTPAVASAAGTELRRGQLIFHDRLGDRPPSAYASFEITTPTAVGSVRLDPIAFDARRGWWVLVVE